MPYMPSGEIRRRARAALKDRFGMTLLATLIANLPLLLSQLVLQIVASPLNTIATRYVNGNITEDVALLSVQRLLEQPIVQICLISILVTLIFTPVLQVGLDRHILHLLRREPAGVGDVFSAVRSFLRALLIGIFKVLLMALCMLPIGLIVYFGLSRVQDPNVLLGAATILSYVYFALVLWIVLTYRMADFVLADAPDTSALGCMRRSRTIMRGRRMQLLWNVVLLAVLTTLLGMVTALFDRISLTLGNAVSIMLSLILAAYEVAIVGAFYETYKNGMSFQPETAGGEPEEKELLNDEVDGTVE